MRPQLRTSLRTLGLALFLGCVAPGFVTGCGDAGTTDGQAVTERSARFELFKGEDGQHYFQLIAANGEQLLRSEGYVGSSGAKNGIQSVQNNAPSIDNFRILEAVNGEHYFNLVAQNGEIIGTSETYASKQGAEAGAEAVSRVAGGAKTANVATGQRFDTFEGKDGQTYFNLRAANGEIILQSEGYASPSGAEAGIESVKENGVLIERFEVKEAQNGQHYFNLQSANGEIIGRGELYASKYNAERGAEGVRRVLRDMTDTGASDDDIRAEVEAAAEGLTYTSEADYGFSWVQADLDGNPELSEALIREKLAPFIDGDEDADSPLAELYSMHETFGEWKTSADSCAAEQDDEWYYDLCVKQAALDRVLEANLSDIQVYYFGSYGSPGYVDGVGVSIVIVGRTPSGNLAGVRTIAIWT